LAGQNYYRIEETDLGDDLHYTTVATVDWTSNVTGFRLYPNPAHGTFSIELTGNGDGPLGVVIEDVTGAIVHRQQFTSATGMVQVTPAQTLAAGIYLIQVTTGKGAQIGKLLVR
jgi:hypothetical protein